MKLFKRRGKRQEPEKQSEFALKLAQTLSTTAKQLVWFYSINGVLWIWCSYILAFMDKVQVVEALSSQVCTVIIGQLGFYLVTKTIENVFQYNDIFAKKKKKKDKHDTSEPPFDGPDGVM